MCRVAKQHIIDAAPIMKVKEPEERKKGLNYLPAILWVSSALWMVAGNLNGDRGLSIIYPTKIIDPRA